MALVVTYSTGEAGHFYEPCRFFIGFVKDPPLIGGELLENSTDCQEITLAARRLTSSPQPQAAAVLTSASEIVVVLKKGASR